MENITIQLDAIAHGENLVFLKDSINMKGGEL
jgi:hypothetical protein